MSTRSYPKDQIPRSFAIIGFGSIGRKHLSSIKKISPTSSVAVLTSQRVDRYHYGANITWHKTIGSILQTQPDFVVVANPAASHGKNLHEFVAKGCKLLIEKPVAATFEQATKIQNVVEIASAPAFVAYNLRFSVAFRVVRDAISSGLIGDIYSVNAVVGQNLEHWRPGREPSKTVSASKKQGGGVLRELSHEIDYLCSLFGEIESASAMLGKQKFVKFDVEDTAMLHLQFGSKTRKILAALHMDFIRNDPCRYCHIIGSDGTLRWDLLAGSVVKCVNSEVHEELYLEPQDLIRTNEIMWRELLKGQYEKFATVDEAAKYLHWIEIMEAGWIMRDG